MFRYFMIVALLPLSLFAKEPKSILHEKTLPLLDAPSFKEPLNATFEQKHGKWIAEKGVMRVVDIPEERHIPVLFHKESLESVVIEFEFRWKKDGTIIVGCDSERHLSRVTVSSDGMSIQDDTNDSATRLADFKEETKVRRWHKIRVEWQGTKIAASLNGKELQTVHQNLSETKSRSWIAASDAAEIRDLKISGK
jgi:hypothetical protein